jgi:hypothetical protein
MTRKWVEIWEEVVDKERQRQSLLRKKRHRALQKAILYGTKDLLNGSAVKHRIGNRLCSAGVNFLLLFSLSRENPFLNLFEQRLQTSKKLHFWVLFTSSRKKSRKKEDREFVFNLVALSLFPVSFTPMSNLFRFQASVSRIFRILSPYRLLTGAKKRSGECCFSPIAGEESVDVQLLPLSNLRRACKMISMMSAQILCVSFFRRKKLVRRCHISSEVSACAITMLSPFVFFIVIEATVNGRIGKFPGKAKL